MRTISALLVVLPALTVLLAFILPHAGAEESDASETDWRAEADARIEKHRKGDFTLTLTGPDGEPLDGVEVTADMTRHHFLWGTAIAPMDRMSESDRVNYRKFITDHFNALVSENEMKWYTIEKKRDQVDFSGADAHMAFAEAHDMTLRGHTLFWSKKKYVQDWVQELSDEELRAEIDAHMKAVLSRYRGRIVHWDVNNEMLNGHFYKDRLGEQIRVHFFKHAAELDPNAILYVNDYSVLGNDSRNRQYVEQIEDLREAGAPVTGIGIQEHGAQDAVAGGRLQPRVVWEHLDNLAEFDLPIHLTEVSFNQADREKQAEAVDTFLRTCFAHPDVDAFLVWGFWANRHWLGKSAALVDADWNLTAGGEKLVQLLTEEWHTRTTETADAGRIAFRGFYGAYDLTYTDEAGQTHRATVELTPDQPTATARFAPAEQ